MGVSNVQLTPFSTQSSELFREKRMKMCWWKNQDCVMLWELDRNRGHGVLSSESHGPRMCHPDLEESGSVPISVSGTLGELNWHKERVND